MQTHDGAVTSPLAVTTGPPPVSPVYNAPLHFKYLTNK